jgi:hypothetical protein
MPQFMQQRHDLVLPVPCHIASLREERVRRGEERVRRGEERDSLSSHTCILQFGTPQDVF